MVRAMADSGKYNTLAGRLEFSAWRKERRIRTADLADLLQVSSHTVSQWLAGLTRPGYIERLALAKLTGIDPDAWLTTEERQALADKIARVERVHNANAAGLFERLAAQL